MTITTRDVLVDPLSTLCRNRRAGAGMVTPDGEFSAIGARAWLDQQRLELLSEVRGFYAPPKPLNRDSRWRLALASPLVAALPEDRSQPIQLEASRGQIDQKTGVSVYEGNVVISSGFDAPDR
jgi:hypothetical protein